MNTAGDLNEPPKIFSLNGVLFMFVSDHPNEERIVDLSPARWPESYLSERGVRFPAMREWDEE